MNGAKKPFRQKVGRPAVFVAAGKGAYANTREVLARFDLSAARGKRVLLKPNAGRITPPGSGITTHPEVVAACMDAFLAVGAIVAVGESPILGVKALEALEAIGVAAAARARGCAVLDLDVRPPVELQVPHGEVMKKFSVCAEVLDHDIIVSVPVMKMHMHTGVTLAVKNMKGCLWRRTKVELHMQAPVPGRADDKPIDVAIADLASVLLPHLSVIDGTVGMEGLGPSAGVPKPLDVVVAGADALAADAVACRLMGIRAEDVPHLRMGAERGAGVIDLDGIDVEPENWIEHASAFARPPENLAFEFPNVNVLDKNSCSACQSTLLLFLKRYGEGLFDYFPKGQTINIAIGKGHAELPEGTLCIGNCTVKHKARGIFVPGCPPVGSQILSAISGRAVEDSCDPGKSS